MSPMLTAIVAILLGCVTVTATSAAATGPEALIGIKEGEVRHGFTAKALFSGLSEKPVGARFVHRTGLIADVLFFASVPQASIAVQTLPVSDRGEPHVLEHLLHLRGRTGGYLQALMNMRLGTGYAATSREMTRYQFRTSAGAEGFYELLNQYLIALVKPDFTDEEVSREVAYVDVVDTADGRLALSIKGTVYNEMVASIARPSYRQPRVLKEMIFGKDHPLARNGGGDPDQFLNLRPEQVRAFHHSNYTVGPRMSLVAALPLSWSADDFLGRLDRILTPLASADYRPTPESWPPFQPAEIGEIRIGAYPSSSANVPQSVLLGWPALPDLDPEEWDALEILMAIIGDGDTSYLHHDLVDQKTRSFDSGVTSVSAELEYITASYPFITLNGLPASALERMHLEQIRAIVMKRIRSIADLPDGSAELSDLARKTRSRLAASRRANLKFIDSPPNFGPTGGRRWHDRLNQVARAPGFIKAVAPFKAYARLDRELASGRNPWTSLVRRTGLTTVPYVVALRPDPSLAEREKNETAARLKRQEMELAVQFGSGDSQKALSVFRDKQNATTAELEALDRTIPRPRFASDPPLTLDDVSFEKASVAGDVPLVRVHFPTTPFADLSVAFSLSSVPPEEWVLLPLLGAAMAENGVTTRGGEALDYIQSRERRDSDVFNFSIAPQANGAMRRYEIQVTASASSSEEIPRTVEWMENHMLRPALRPDARARLIDICRKTIQSLRGVLETPEANWAIALAAAYEYQDDPQYLALESVFTKLRLLTRLRWRMEDPSPEVRRRILSGLEAVDRLLTDQAEQAAVAARLQSVDGDLGETLRYELSMLPQERWREDLAELLSDMRKDIEVGSARVIEDLERLRRRVLVRAGARARVTASPANADVAAKLLHELLIKLPPKSEGTPATSRISSIHARIEQRYGPLSRPVHVGFVRPDAKAGVHVVVASGPSYKSPSREAALDHLAVGIFSGVGPQSFLMKTNATGLAYGGGIAKRTTQGRILYYADRCPDLAETMKFVSGVAIRQPVTDPLLIDYSLADAFVDFRGANDFSSRGAALANNLADGITPAKVSTFKRLLLEAARDKDVLVRLRERLPDVVGRVIVGYGRKVSDSPGAVAFAIGPEELLASYEMFLKEQGEADRLIRLYPRDFWPLSEEATKLGGALPPVKERK